MKTRLLIYVYIPYSYTFVRNYINILKRKPQKKKKKYEYKLCTKGEKLESFYPFAYFSKSKEKYKQYKKKK